MSKCLFPSYRDQRSRPGVHINLPTDNIHLSPKQGLKVLALESVFVCVCVALVWYLSSNQKENSPCLTQPMTLSLCVAQRKCFNNIFKWLLTEAAEMDANIMYLESMLKACQFTNTLTLILYIFPFIYLHLMSRISSSFNMVTLNFFFSLCALSVSYSDLGV